MILEGKIMLKGKRIVIKLGTSTLTHPNGTLNYHKMEQIARMVADAKGAGNEVIIVTSAAISAGTSSMGLKERPKELRYKMAVAAVGQVRLMHVYDSLFSQVNCHVGQILLTGDNVADPEDRFYLKNTFESLLSMGVIPVVNENDSISSAEIESGRHKVLGDNDTLSAIVAKLTDADILILVSDIDGLYDCDPRKNSDALLISEVNELSPEIESMAGSAGSTHGTGGMTTKLEAARIALDVGFWMYIINGDNIENLYDVLEGRKTGTVFRRKK